MKWNDFYQIEPEWLLKKITEHTEEPIDDNMLKQLADKLQERVTYPKNFGNNNASIT